MKKKKKKKTDRGEQKKVFSQTYILFDKAGVVNPTFVGELEQYVNIFLNLQYFLKNVTKTQRISRKTKKKLFFSWKITTPATKSSH